MGGAGQRGVDAGAVTYRILTLDGGGAWAIIEVRALIELYGAAAQGHDVLRRFDMVAANSGGSIVLAGLVEGKTLGEILALFEDEANRRAIFSPTKMMGDATLRSLTGLGPKYSAQAKLPALERLLPKTGDTPLRKVMAGLIGPSGGEVRLLIISFDYDRNTAAFFRSAASGGGAYGNGEPTTLSLAAAVHASTNAPVNYFDTPAMLPGCPDRYWDGGLTGNNNPALAACVEAATVGHDPRDLRVLSLGSATVRLPLAAAGSAASPCTAPRPDSNVVNDLAKLAGSILDDPPDFATFAVHALTGGAAGLPAGVESRIVRMNPLVSPTSAPDGGWTVPAWLDSRAIPAHLRHGHGCDRTRRSGVYRRLVFAMDRRQRDEPADPHGRAKLRGGGWLRQLRPGQTGLDNAAKLSLQRSSGRRRAGLQHITGAVQPAVMIMIARPGTHVGAGADSAARGGLAADVGGASLFQALLQRLEALGIAVWRGGCGCRIGLWCGRRRRCGDLRHADRRLQRRIRQRG